MICTKRPSEQRLFDGDRYRVVGLSRIIIMRTFITLKAAKAWRKKHGGIVEQAVGSQWAKIE